MASPTPIVEGFADGACKGNPGRGGWGAVVYERYQTHQIAWKNRGGSLRTTNQQMELTGAIECIRLARPIATSEIRIWLDSRYVLGGLVVNPKDDVVTASPTGWIAGWRRRGWTKADGSEVKNLELWKRLTEEVEATCGEGKRIRFSWVRGHTEHTQTPESLGNQEADRLANEGVPKPLRVLVACECSGEVRNAFARRGHDAWSCDLKPSETPGQHIQGDVREVLKQKWDLIIAHPPCTYLSVSGLHWNQRTEGRAEKTEEALDFAKIFFDSECPRVAIENPVSCISTRIRKPDQIVQPYEYGHDASKKTCLWLKGLPRLIPTGPYVEPRIVDGKPRWGNQTDSGQNKLPPSKERAALRSKTYSGIAEAMATQWG